MCPLPRARGRLSRAARGFGSAADGQADAAAERLAIEAAVSGDRAVALRALLANPLVPGSDAAAGLLDAILEANLRYLPRFATAG